MKKEQRNKLRRVFILQAEIMRTLSRLITIINQRGQETTLMEVTCLISRNSFLGRAQGRNS
jgi:hypothetical protein